ncbi:MAG: hypothetical protein JNK46_05560 [Methylobacteriaceae bacterium]|nr:hypothetical protein [Methylobacteriaceae bacterium]
MRRPPLALAAALAAAPALAQTPPVETRFKITPRVSQAMLYETNPASLPYGARGFWSSSTVVGLDVTAPLTPYATLSASAQNRFWRYPTRTRWHSNDASGSVALTLRSAGFSYGARLGAFGSYDPGFSERKELRADAAIFVSRTIETPLFGAQVTPTLTLSHRRADAADGDKTRLSASLVAQRKFGIVSVIARVGAAYDVFGCRAVCRRDVEVTAGLGATLALAPNADIGLGVDMERTVSNRPGQGYLAATFAPRAVLRFDF